MSRKSQSATFSLQPDAIAKLEQIALKFGCLWKEKPNVSKLLREIAEGEIELKRRVPPEERCPICGNHFDECEYFESLEN